MTATQQALQVIERGIEVAKRDQSEFKSRCVKISKGGYFFINGQRCSRDQAVQALAHVFNEEARKDLELETPELHTWDRLNLATHDFFFELCERMQELSKDHSLSVPVRVGKHGVRIELKDCPRLTNLKRAGVIRGFAGEKKTQKFLQLTELGQAKWATHQGA